MRKALQVALVLLAGTAWIGLPGSAIDLGEIGLEIEVLPDPLRSDEGLQWGAALGAYCKVGIADGWTMRGEVTSPLFAFLPQFGLAATYAASARWAVEAQLTIQSTALGSLLFTLHGGGRVLVAGTGTSRLLFSSFPVALVGMHTSYGGFSVFPVAGLNGYLDVSWLPSDHLIVGQSVGFSIAKLGPDVEMLFPLGEIHGLVLSATTHAGYRP
jgi:hypothetical protein